LEILCTRTIIELCKVHSLYYHNLRFNECNFLERTNEIMYYPYVSIHFDGASRNNPRGPAGCGWTMSWGNEDLSDSGRFASGNKYLGYNVSNNQAEYEGLLQALEYMLDQNISCHGLYIRGDSKIVIHQLDGSYQVRSNNLIGLYNDVRNMLSEINCSHFEFLPVDRYRNRHADSLANQAIECRRRY